MTGAICVQKMSNQYIFEPPTDGKVILHTSCGDVEVELWSKEAPKTCRNFVQLCMEGYYDGTIFHRLVKDFILQGGDPTGTGQGGESIYGKPFKDEFHQRLSFNRRGMLGMANAGKDQNGSQFFFTIGTEPARELTKKHTLFGKVVGATVHNMLAMAECGADDNERPHTIHKIIKTTVLSNPFDDIVPRERESKKKKKEKKEESKPKTVETKKLNLLSFGDEAEEDGEAILSFSKSSGKKPKSAHDLLADDGLSKQVAVTADEMADYHPVEQDDDEAEGALSRIRERLKKRKMMADEEGEGKKRKGEEDEDMEDIIESERKARMQAEIEKAQATVKAEMKKYMKELRPKKEKKPAPEPDASENMKKYTNMKMKFKDKTKTLVKARDPERESQTDNLMERFKLRLGKANQEAILFDRKIEIDDPVKKKKEEEQKEEEEEKPKFGVDLDAEDEKGQEWMTARFVAQDEEDPNVTKAKDANLRETSEDWYDITDPRNPMNKRRRGEV